MTRITTFCNYGRHVTNTFQIEGHLQQTPAFINTLIFSNQYMPTPKTNAKLPSERKYFSKLKKINKTESDDVLTFFSLSSCCDCGQHLFGTATSKRPNAHTSDKSGSENYEAANVLAKAGSPKDNHVVFSKFTRRHYMNIP